MDVSMIRTMRRQGDIPYRLIPKNPLEFNDDPCFPMDCKDVIPLCNIIESCTSSLPCLQLVITPINWFLRR